MNDALFKKLGEDMSLEEEAEFTRRLAAAYREQEAGEQRPEVERIARLVRELLSEPAQTATRGDRGAQ
jgi:hypothetical protein